MTFLTVLKVKKDALEGVIIGLIFTKVKIHTCITMPDMFGDNKYVLYIETPEEGSEADKYIKRSVEAHFIYEHKQIKS